MVIKYNKTTYMHTKTTMDVETGRKQDTAENHQGNYPQE